MSISNLKSVIAIYEDAAFYHNVNQKGNLGAAQNLTIRAIKTLFRANLEESKSKMIGFLGLIPENVLYYDPFGDHIIFYTKPDYRTLFFKSFPTAKYRIPYLLWVFENNRLSVFALKTKPKNLKAELFNAPFMNVYSSGNVCMGTVSMDIEYSNYDSLMESIIDKFFNSFFTHTNNDNLLKINYQNFLEKYANKNDYNFSKLLYPTGLKLESIWPKK